jgi:tetratricopeptide (TPR) repeat protein
LFVCVANGQYVIIFNVMINKGMFSKMGDIMVKRYIEDLEKEISQKPEDKDLIFKLGVAYVKINDIDKARECYKKLKTMDEVMAKELFDMMYEV